MSCSEWDFWHFWSLRKHLGCLESPLDRRNHTHKLLPGESVRGTCNLLCPWNFCRSKNYNDFRLLSCRSKASWTEHQNASFGILSGRSDRGCVVRVVRMCSRVVTVATCCVVSLLFCLPSCKDTEFATEFGKEMLEAGADVAGVQPDFLFFTLQDFKWKRQTLNTE